MTKITFKSRTAALEYAAHLESLGFSSVLTPYMVKENRFCRDGSEVYICINR